MRFAMLMTLALVLFGCATLKPSQGPFLRLDHIHVGGATAVAFSPGGERIASGGYDGSVAVWRVPQGEPVVHARPHRDPVRGLAWLDADTMLSAAEDGRITVWDAATGATIRQTVAAPVKAMGFERDHHTLITIHDDRTVRMYDSRTLQERRRVSLAAVPTAIAYEPGTGQIAVATDAGQVLRLDRALHIVQRLTAPRTVHGLAFSPDGRYLAGGAWFRLLIWDLRDGRLDVRDTEHFGAIVALAYTPDGTRLATIGRHTDGGVRLVDAADNHVVRRLLAHEACGWSVRLSPDGRYLATSSEDESVRLYDLQAPYEPGFQHPR